MRGLPKYPEGTRVWLIENAQAGHEPATGTVVVAGKPWYVVRLDVEHRWPTNPDGYVDVQEKNLEEVECRHLR